MRAGLNSLPRPLEPDAERRRIAAALVHLVAVRGFASLRQEELLAAAGVDSAAFARHFTGRQDCFDRVWGEIANDFITRLRSAYAGGGEEWRDRLRAAAHFILRYFLADQERTRFFMLGVLEGGLLAETRRDLVMQAGIDIVDAGRQELADPGSMSRSTADAVVVAIYEKILAELHSGGGVEALPRLVPRLMQSAVLPYLGPRVAAEELRIPPPRLQGRG